ncbi:hypothetical protein EVAR_92522_1 [Eumeta japonica]|uniref:Uncharacterized protein n=1 Tax=Eumeta variegata TaxID=151549 RepID=A0A4C1T9M5_EUMVA|nr:hypothetical protein EVAR_92522_1 [Eumeta japonica]
MSASARARGTCNHKSRRSLDKEGYGPRIGIPISGAKRVKRFQERRKAATARSEEGADSASTSTSARVFHQLFDTMSNNSSSMAYHVYKTTKLCFYLAEPSPRSSLIPKSSYCIRINVDILQRCGRKQTYRRTQQTGTFVVVSPSIEDEPLLFVACSPTATSRLTTANGTLFYTSTARNEFLEIAFYFG